MRGVERASPVKDERETIVQHTFNNGSLQMDLSIPEALAGRFDALWQWLSRQYGLELIHPVIGSEALAIYKIADADRALDRALQDAGGPAGPYWAELWPSALALGQFLESQTDFHHLSAVELGCGLGVAGICAGRKGAQVLLTDAEPDALRMAELNWILNFGEMPHTALLDWRNLSLAQHFDLILAADVAYEPALFSPLIEAFRKLLRPDGRIYLSEPNRPVAQPFFAQLRESGFRYRAFEESVENNGKIARIAIYEIRHPNAPADFGN